MTVVPALEEFIATRSEWLSNQFDNFGLNTPEKAYSWAFQSANLTQETFAEVAVAKTLLFYLKEEEADSYDPGLLILAGQQHTNLPVGALLKALSSINYALTA